MKILFSILFLSILSSCATNVEDSFYTRERMLPNGNWVLDLYSARSCSDILADQFKGTDGVKEESKSTIFNKSLSDIIYPKRNEENPELYKKCVDIFQPNMAPRSKSLCSNGVYELYGCVQVREQYLDLYYNNVSWVMGCYLKCK